MASQQIIDAIETDNVLAYRLLVGQHDDVKSLLAHMNFATDAEAENIIAHLYAIATPDQVICLVDRNVLIKNIEIQQDADNLRKALNASVNTEDCTCTYGICLE